MIGISRVRNEELIIEDTLRHVLDRVESVILYDDCSTDRTVEIAKSFDRVDVIEGKEWRADRRAEETRHRAMLLDRVKADWVWCFDADERMEGPMPPMAGDGWRLRLFDGYMTPECQAPYTGGALALLPRMWGPEYRDILMVFRVSAASFRGPDRREPVVSGRVELAQARVKHFGKCLSVEHWEETCDYYANHWPEPYRSKWAGRRGKAIHTMSDFGRPLYEWGEVAGHAVRL